MTELNKESIEWARYRAAHYDRVWTAIEGRYIEADFSDIDEILWAGFVRAQKSVDSPAEQ